MDYLLCAFKPESIFSTLKLKALLKLYQVSKIDVDSSLCNKLFICKKERVKNKPLHFTILNYVRQQETNLSCFNKEKEKKAFDVIPFGLGLP